MTLHMKICKKCIQPDTRPDIFFTEDGVCGACLWEEEKKLIDWDAREKELSDIANWAKEKNSDYDCVIGVSGGKDSTTQAIIAKEKLGLHCLLVNGEPDNATELGKENIENLKNLGFDVISLRPNPKVLRTLVKRDFYKYLNPVKVTEYTLWASAHIIAEKFNIPLIIQGQNIGLTVGASNSPLGKGSDALKINECDTLSAGWQDYLEVKDVNEKDLIFYRYDRQRLEKKGIRAIWLQYFMKEWSDRGNAEFSKQYGVKWREEGFDPSSIGTYVPYVQLDSSLHQVNQMLKHIKLGFGECMDHACYDIREGRITRQEGIDLVKKYDGKCGQSYIDNFCKFLNISLDEFWKISNSFRGPMWIKDKDDNWYNKYWDELKN